MYNYGYICLKTGRKVKCRLNCTYLTKDKITKEYTCRIHKIRKETDGCNSLGDLSKVGK